ncbi:hypothetical protein [Leifsonia sp. NPDC080035]|uniref:Uncharacterized protein n=1 Tax=Leifsonia sp. NPDC080035 TaxID=3143936 RepID=A0AAU7GGG8_9MICO
MARTLPTPDGTRRSTELAVASSLTDIVDGFEWAAELALSWVQTGRTGAMPSYWAGLTDRPMFYSRDLAHQALGGHLLGLDEENLAMFQHFAESATARRRYYPLWAFTFDGEPAAIDYRSDDDFVRETPAPYELVEKSIEQYRWTRDRRWLDSPALAAFHRNTVFLFTDAHDVHGIGAAGERAANDIFAGSPTYNEIRTAPDLQLAGDGLASQWAATRAYAEVAPDPADRAEADRRAASLLRLFEERWWNEQEGHYVPGFTDRGPVDVFALEPSWFPAVKSMIPAGERAQRHLAYLAEGLEVSPPPNIEAFTYLPEAFGAYGHDAVALRWLRHLIASRADYPEVPFTVVSHIAAGLTGLRPTLEGDVETRSHLPEGEWIEVRGVRIGDAELTVRHDGDDASELTVTAGTQPVRWSAHFPDSTRHAVVPVGATVRLTP